MTRRGHILAALFLFVLFVAYGLQATMIPSFPGQELEPFKPRTMPVSPMPSTDSARRSPSPQSRLRGCSMRRDHTACR